MHIPDGYISPIISVGMGVATIPTWGVASQKVKAVLSDRTIPLLAIFSAMSFTIMMFNVPVPGGTTAHGVGATLMAIVLGPWAAVIGVSVALIIQALFFGDGGVLAILINCFNMAIVMPFVGYWTYRALAGRSDILSSRRAWAAGIAAYVAITVSAILVGIELGIQPILFTENGHALYSPYGLEAAIPAMILAHVFGASIVEGAITYLGVIYLQKRHPEYLTRLPGVFATTDASEGQATPRPLWQLVTATVMGAVVLLGIIGIVLGGGDPSHAFGADWSSVDWAAVGSMLFVVALIFAILVPLAWILLPEPIKRVGTAFVGVAVIAPLGLIAPGFAYGEGSAGDVQAAFGYIPAGLHDLSTFFSAPLAGYELPLRFLGAGNAELWRAGIGYEIAGIVGILLCGVAIYGLSWVLRPRGSTAAEDATATSVAAATSPRATAPATARPTNDRERNGHIGWLEHTLAGIAGSVERAVFTESHARSRGWLQGVDPRAKLVMFITVILAASLSGSIPVLIGLYAVILVVAAASRIPFDFFVKRVWLGIPLFAGLVVIPSIFFVPGPSLFELQLGPLMIAPSIPGIIGAILFVIRVAVCVSLAVLLVLTTPWADLLKSLQAIRVPQVFILVLAMTYRYIFLFLHLANGMFEARKSRVVARTSGAEQRRWIAGTMGNLLNRSVKMSNDVYGAMAARGFTGTIRSLQAYRMRASDWAALVGASGVAIVTIAAGRMLG